MILYQHAVQTHLKITGEITDESRTNFAKKVIARTSINNKKKRLQPLYNQTKPRLELNVKTIFFLYSILS